MSSNNNDSFGTKLKNIYKKGAGLSLLLLLAFSMYAVYLSWSCNSNCYPGMGSLEKVFRAIGAAFGNLGYLITYFIYWKPQCKWGPCATK
jgi:hypothetical protein